MKSYLIAFLFLTACASQEPERREFHDGPMVRPAPAFVTPGATPAGAGLPEYVPGTAAPVSRGTDRRVLPPTREPGVWASDKPKISGEIATPVMLGINIPIPVDDNGKPDYLFANQCAEATDTMFKESTLKAPAQRLRYEERECLTARIYDMCIGYMNRDRKNNEQLLLVQGAERVVEAMKRSGIATAIVARGYLSEKCHPKTNSPAVDAIFKEVLTRW